MKKKFFKMVLGASLVAQWLRLHTYIAGGTSSTPGWSHMLLGAAKKQFVSKKGFRKEFI